MLQQSLLEFIQEDSGPFPRMLGEKIFERGTSFGAYIWVFRAKHISLIFHLSAVGDVDVESKKLAHTLGHFGFSMSAWTSE